MAGQHAHWHAQCFTQFWIPVEGFQIHEHGAAGVGHVGDMDATVDAAGQVPDDPGVDVAEQGVAGFGRFAHGWHVFQ